MHQENVDFYFEVWVLFLCRKKGLFCWVILDGCLRLFLVFFISLLLVVFEKHHKFLSWMDCPTHQPIGNLFSSTTMDINTKAVYFSTSELTNGSQKSIVVLIRLAVKYCYSSRSAAAAYCLHFG